MKTIFTFLTFLIIFTVVVVGGSVAWFFSQLKPVSDGPVEPISFVIPKGQAAAVVAGRLQEEGLIRSGLVFRVIARLDGIDSHIQSGSFKLSPHMTPDEIGRALTSGSEDIWVTILEGWRAEEIAEVLADEELPLFDPDEFIALAKPDEGRLYPDSYLVPKEYTAVQMHSLLVNTFETKIIDGLEDEIAASGRPFAESLIMASIIEREARGLDEMRRVAGILWNRVNIGMALQADATLQYIAGYNKIEQSWWSPPDVAVKQSTSQYNTYKNAGLPPAPISNPGKDAIVAALTPIDSDNLFYLHGRDGTIYYAETLDEHNANIDRYLR